MGLSVASVTVAYNGAESLPRQIEALLEQNRPLQEIIVVDNASSDRSALLAERYPHITVLRMTENLGVGGGLAAGLAYAAREKKHDWIWTFDQDSVPHKDSLEMLLTDLTSISKHDPKVGIAATLPVHEGSEFLYRPWLWRDGLVKPSREALRESIWYADLVITAGSMIRRDVVEAVGLPREDFFMDFVDFEYCKRARSRGYKVIVVPRARITHELGNSREVRLAGFRTLWYDQAPFREYYYSRNLAYFVWWLYPSKAAKRFVMRHLVRRAAGLLLFGSNKLACLKKIGQGFRDGRQAHLGIRFRPTDA